MCLLGPLGLPVIALGVFRSVPSIDFLFRNVQFHLVVVTSIAACALTISVLATKAAAHSRNAGPVWLAVGCASVGVLMFSHGLLTPGVMGTPMNRWVGREPYLAITLFAVALVLAGRPKNSLTSLLASRHPRLVVATPFVVLGAAAAFLQMNPTAWGGTAPLSWENGVLWVVAAVDIVLLSALAVVHWRRWRLGHDVVQYALVLSASMSAAAMLSFRVGEPWRVSWWDYHGFLLAGFAGAVYAVVVRYRRHRAVDRVLSSTFEHDPMRHIVEGYPAALRSLVGTLEAKDLYTHGHSERTARLAVQLGLRLGVDEDTLRIVARGGYLHDVGKLAISDAILNKPGRLTPEERTVIETHPRRGYELVSPVSTLREVLPAVLHHHERWDGAGYPSGLTGRNIPLGARIVAVADVWDALTSDRSYRPGLAPEMALAHIISGRGSHFDPVMVDAFVSLAADWGYQATTGGADPQEGWRAAETCHDSMASTA